MYDIEWDLATGGYTLIPTTVGIRQEVRPVFYEELKLLGFDEYWQFPKTELPLLWAEGARRYIYQGELVAEARGGGFYTRPELIIKKHDLRLKPVRLTEMLQKNSCFMTGLEQQALEFIYATYQKYCQKKYDVCYVAFSGGKDSLVLLDLVQRALAHEDFVVVFGDTGMEIKSTYQAVDRAKARWQTLSFYTAACAYSPQETWDSFGHPSRIMRWCCSVHKSAPSLLLLKEVLNKVNFKAVAFDGIRAGESNARASYSNISERKKHVVQTNCSPILEWNSAEVFLYLFQRDLMLNEAYRYGLVRVGCAVCPLASRWWEYLGYSIYKDDVQYYLEQLEQYALKMGVPEQERREYIESGGWKGRAGGKELENAGVRIVEQVVGDVVIFLVRQPETRFLNWIKALGLTVQKSETEFEQQIGKDYFSFTVNQKRERKESSISPQRQEQSGIKVEFKGLVLAENRRELNIIRKLFNKVAYCIGCGVCAAECSTGALQINKNKVSIDGNKCTSCLKCFTMEKGCLVAKSLAISRGGKNVTLKGMNRYNHFGLRQKWLEFYFDMQDEVWFSDKLGNRQLDALRVWLKEAGITANNKMTPLGEKLVSFGSRSLLTWAVIWINLAYNSTIARWYITKVPWGGIYSKKTLIEMLGDDYSESTRKNAITSLVELLRHSPLGNDLCFGQLEMIGRSNRVKDISKTGWSKPERIIVLYALYCYAEQQKGHYSFTFSELEQFNETTAAISPLMLFGTNKNEIKKIIQGLAINYASYLNVDFSRGLDNIFLDKERTSIEVLNLE